ncbi:MAG: hypothetical protein JKY31_04050 [Rhodobacteraceae bacterium]|nr:hypothetical protein [Paracoccaceae bacterium]
MSKISERFAQAFAAGRAASADVQKSVKTPTTVMALISGQSVSEVLDAVAKLKTASNRVILVTDKTDIELFQIDGCVTEYLPLGKLSTQGLSCGNPETYLKQRLVILVQKWTPKKVDAIGDIAKNLLDQWQSSEPR